MSSLSGTSRPTPRAIFFFLAYFLMTESFASYAVPSTSLHSQTPSKEPAKDKDSGRGTPPDPCSQAGTSCPMSLTSGVALPPGVPGLTHYIEKRSSDAFPGNAVAYLENDSLEVQPRDGYHGRFGSQRRLYESVGRLNQNMKGRPVFNVPFRVLYGNEKKGFKFGKRFFADDEDWNDILAQRDVRGGERSRFKFGKRFSNLENDWETSEPDEEVEEELEKKWNDAKMKNFEPRTRATSSEGGKRKFKFGKKSEDLAAEEKRKIMFGRSNSATGSLGKFSDDDELNEDLSEDGTERNLSEEKRRPKFQFGKRVQTMYPMSSKLKNKFKLGK